MQFVSWCLSSDSDIARHPNVTKTRISPTTAASDVERTGRKHSGRVHAEDGLGEVEVLVQAQPDAVVPAQGRLGGKHSPRLRRNFFQRDVSGNLQLCRRRRRADADGIVPIEGDHAAAAAYEENAAANVADLRLPEMTGCRTVGAAEIPLHIER